MFVDITAPKKPLAADMIFRECYRGRKEITPEICFEVLKATNYATCIKRMLECVERLPEENQAAFREAVLAVFTNRDQPDEVEDIGRCLAKSGGYEEEFEKTLDDIAGNVYLCSAPDRELFCVLKESSYFNAPVLEGRKGAICMGPEIKFTKYKKLPPRIKVSKCDYVGFNGCDMAGVKDLKFKEGATVHIYFCENPPEQLDVSMCDEVRLTGSFYGVRDLRFKKGAKVNLNGMRTIAADIDVSMCEEVRFGECSLGGSLKAGKSADLSYAKRIPRAMDFSQTDWVAIFRQDFRFVEALTFKEGSRVCFKEAENLPEFFDVSMCGAVELSCCDLGNVKDLKFSNAKKVCLYCSYHLPEVLDLSAADEVNLEGANFRSVKEIKFKKGAKVNLMEAFNLPETVDLSPCAEVALVHADWKNTKEIKIADTEQMRNAVAYSIPDNWGGKIEFAKADKQNTVMNGAQFMTFWRGNRR